MVAFVCVVVVVIDVIQIRGLNLKQNDVLRRSNMDGVQLQA